MWHPKKAASGLSAGVRGSAGRKHEAVEIQPGTPAVALQTDSDLGILFHISCIMSGIEVAGLVFGVLPMLVEVVKSYSTVADGLHTFRHYSKEVKSISLQVNVQNGIFLNHCRLMLRLVEDEKAAEDMLEDKSDRRWTSKDLNDKLSDVLRDSFKLCWSIIEETKDVIDEIKGEMEKFDELKARKKKVCACPPR
jgi:hypothetical protein